MLNSLETLRILSALAVVFAHNGIFDIPLLNYFLGTTNLFLGSIGVDIFFVISGFVMFLSSQKIGYGLSGAKKFISSRFIRIFPLYLIINFILVFFLYLKHIVVGPDYLIQSLLLLPTIYPGGKFEDPLLYLGWTLRFEFFFYLLIAFGIILNKRLLFPVFGLMVASVLNYFFNFYYGAPIVFEFIFGYLMAYFINAYKVEMASKKIVVCCFLLSIVLLLLASIGKDFNYYPNNVESMVPRMHINYHDFSLIRPIAWGIPAALVVFFAVLLEKKIVWRLAFMGKFTYSVYLLQYFINTLAPKFKSIAPDWLAFIEEIFVLLFLSMLTYQFIESPFLGLKKKW